jgi:hypothetical protein
MPVFSQKSGRRSGRENAMLSLAAQTMDPLKLEWRPLTPRSR